MPGLRASEIEWIAGLWRGFYEPLPRMFFRKKYLKTCIRCIIEVEMPIFFLVADPEICRSRAWTRFQSQLNSGVFGSVVSKLSVYAIEVWIYTHDTIPLYTVYRYTFSTYRYKFFARTSSGMFSASQWKSGMAYRFTPSYFEPCTTYCTHEHV